MSVFDNTYNASGYILFAKTVLYKEYIGNHFVFYHNFFTSNQSASHNKVSVIYAYLLFCDITQSSL